MNKIVLGLLLAAQLFIPTRGLAGDSISPQTANTIVDPIARWFPNKENAVTITCEINEQGRVSRILANSASDMIKPAYLLASTHWQFEPATRNGKAVRSVVTVQFTYRIQKLGSIISTHDIGP